MPLFNELRARGNMEIPLSLERAGSQDVWICASCCAPVECKGFGSYVIETRGCISGAVPWRGILVNMHGTCVF